MITITIAIIIIVIVSISISISIITIEQPIPEAMKRNVASQLAACSEEAIRLLTLANSLGKVILVTLSRESWVVRSCRNFCPKLQDQPDASKFVFRGA
eukprot:s2259_g9.t1